MNFLLALDLLGGVVIDLLHGFIGGRGLAFDRQQIVHQEPVAGEGEAGLEVVAILDFLGFGSLGDDLHVDQERQYVFFLGRGVHLGEAGPEFFLGQRDVALANFSAVHLGEHGVGIFGPHRQAGEQNHRKTAGGGKGEAGARAEFRFG